MTWIHVVTYIVAIVWLGRRAIEHFQARREMRPPRCHHRHAVEVRTDNDLDRGTLVAWWCAACETQLPSEFPGATRFVKHGQTDLQVTRPGDAEWEQETGITMCAFREGPEPIITPSQFDDLNRRFADHRAVHQTVTYKKPLNPGYG